MFPNDPLEENERSQCSEGERRWYVTPQSPPVPFIYVLHKALAPPLNSSHFKDDHCSFKWKLFFLWGTLVKWIVKLPSDQSVTLVMSSQQPRNFNKSRISLPAALWHHITHFILISVPLKESAAHNVPFSWTHIKYEHLVCLCYQSIVNPNDWLLYLLKSEEVSWFMYLNYLLIK